jgi:hypothetical protein
MRRRIASKITIKRSGLKKKSERKDLVKHLDAGLARKAKGGKRPKNPLVSPLLVPSLTLISPREGFSNQSDRPYRAGRQKHWIKVKNRKHPAYERVKEVMQLR